MDSVVFVVYLLVKLEKVFFIVIVGSYEESGWSCYNDVSLNFLTIVAIIVLLMQVSIVVFIQVADFTFTLYRVPDNIYGVFDHQTKVRSLILLI